MCTRVSDRIKVPGNQDEREDKGTCSSILAVPSLLRERTKIINEGAFGLLAILLMSYKEEPKSHSERNNQIDFGSCFRFGDDQY